MKCLVVDDNKMARTAMKQMIRQFDFLELAGECESPVEAFNFLHANQVDLLFLDVEMPGMTGIELVRNLDRRPIIILVTARKDYAVEAFELDVADYVVKPVSMARFTRAVKKARELFDANKHAEANEVDNDFIFVRSDSILTKVKAKGIVYVQDLGNHICIQTTERKHDVNTTLKSVADKLPEDRFYRLHPSYIVALDKIDTVENNTAYVGRHHLPISKQYKGELLKRLKLVES